MIYHWRNAPDRRLGAAVDAWICLAVRVQIGRFCVLFGGVWSRERDQCLGDAGQVAGGHEVTGANEARGALP